MMKPPYAKGDYQVTRFCCTSGLCFECHAAGNHGDKARRKRVVHTYGVSRKWAEYVAHRWSEGGYWSPQVEKMPSKEEAV